MLQEWNEDSSWDTHPVTFPSLLISEGIISISLLVFHLDPCSHWRLLGVPWWDRALSLLGSLLCVYGLLLETFLLFPIQLERRVPEFPPFLVASCSSSAKKFRVFIRPFPILGTAGGTRVWRERILVSREILQVVL